MTTIADVQRKIILGLWDTGMVSQGTRTDDGGIRVTTDDGSEFKITIEKVR